MQNISLDEAFDRFDNMEVVERWNSVGERWIKIRKCPTDVKSLEWCVNEEQDYWIKYSNNFGLMHFFLKGKYRLPQQKINFKEVPWYKAIEWMKNNPNKKARLNHTNINNQTKIDD